MRIAMVLSGGGARAAFEAGVIEAFERAGVVPDILAGTSAGAINATAMAVGMPAAELTDLWLDLRSKDVYRVRLDLPTAFRPLRALGRVAGHLLDPASLAIRLLDAVGWTWFLDPSPLRQLLHDQLGQDVIEVMDGKVLNVVAVEAVTGKLIRFTNREPDDRDDDRYRAVQMTVDHVVASAAIPVVFKPVEIEGGLYWDGGLGANTPLAAALGHKPDVCFVVATGAVDRTAKRPKTLSESISLLVDDLLRSSLVKDLEHAERINDLVEAREGETRYKRVQFHLIAPPASGAGVSDFLNFDASATGLLIEQGRRAGAAALVEWAEYQASRDREEGSHPSG